MNCRDFESFGVQGKNEKMSKLLYTYYIGNVNGKRQLNDRFTKDNG